MADEEDGKDDYFLEMPHCALKVAGQGYKKRSTLKFRTLGLVTRKASDILFVTCNTNPSVN